MDVRRGKRADPRRDIDLFTSRLRIYGARHWLVLLDVPTPQPDRDEPLRMIVEIARPVVTDEVMEIDADAAPQFQKRPPHEIRCAAAVPVHLFTLEDAVNDFAHHYVPSKVTSYSTPSTIRVFGVHSAGPATH